MSTICPDVSEYQNPVNDHYNRDWLIFRACDGSYVDRNASHNLAWAIAARKSGKLKGFTVYVVYRPGKNSVILQTLDRLGVPNDCVVMIDAETWGSQIVGDHSDDINNLAKALRSRQQGNPELVWGYGNRGPDISVWPHKPNWMGWVVASYGGSKPDVPNIIGWQYTNGEYVVSGLPNSSPPFGHCDHNVIYKLPTQAAQERGFTVDTEAKARFDSIDQRLAQLDSYFKGTDGVHHTVERTVAHVTQGMTYASKKGSIWSRLFRRSDVR